jgi:predicted nucleotidyltransferase
MDLSTISEKIQPLLKEYPIKKLGVFGSYARGTQTSASDIDFLVEFHKPVGLEFFKLSQDLEHILGVSVDIGTYRSLKSQVRERALREQVVIYGT